MYHDSDMTPGTKHDVPAPARKILQSCRALGLTFVDEPETLHKEMHRLEWLSKYALDLVFGNSGPTVLNLSEKIVRKNLSRHLKSSERLMVAIIGQLAELVDKNRRDQKIVRAIDAVVDGAIDSACQGSDWERGSDIN
jgi:hypothetical protein